MKDFEWNAAKNESLRQSRGICFEDDEGMFPKTVIPSRRMTRNYLGR